MLIFTILFYILLLLITGLVFLWLTTPKQSSYEEYLNLNEFKPEDFMKNIPEKILKNINWRNKRHYWYPVAFSKELGMKKPLGFLLLGEPLVLFRDTSGKAHCLVDRCPHRSTKLSLGNVVNGNLECMYHGWQFSGDGKCQKVPSVDEKKSNFKSLVCSDSRVCHEELNILWVWAGPKNLADLSLIPRYLHRESFLKNFRIYDVNIPIDLDATLLIDNFMDVAHVDFTHDGSLGNKKLAGPVTYTEVKDSKYKVPGSAQYSVEFRGNKNLITFIPPCYIKQESTLKGNKLIIQVFAIIPTEPGKCKFTTTFYGTIIPYFMVRMFDLFNKNYWYSRAKKIVYEDMEMLEGVNDNVKKGSKIFNKIVNADIMIKRYRDWENEVQKEHNPWFVSYSQRDMEDILKDNE